MKSILERRPTIFVDILFLLIAVLVLTFTVRIFTPRTAEKLDPVAYSKCMETIRSFNNLDQKETTLLVQFCNKLIPRVHLSKPIF